MARAFRSLPALPVLLLAAMLVIAAGIELFRFDHLLWLPKLPLALLLVAAFARTPRGRGGASR
jgi:hypothetical protein